MIHQKRHGKARIAGALALMVGGASASLAAVSITDIAVAPDAGGGVKLSYRLNQAATSVSIQVAGDAAVIGGVSKGLNTITLPSGASGKTATITAAAPAPNGVGGAEVLIPVTTPDNRATPASTALVAVDVNRRAGSPYLGRIYLPTGFSQAGQKYLWVYAPDGTLVQTKNLSDIATSGSYPYGFGVARTDTKDRLVVHNRSIARDYVLGPDLALLATQGSTSNLVPGMAITPGSGNEAQPWNIWQAGTKNMGLRHFTSDLATDAGFSVVDTAIAVEASSTGENCDDIAVDNANMFMFKVQKTDGGVGPLATGGANKWTSADNGATWTEDVTWLSNFLADVSTDLGAAGSALTTNDLIGGGVTLGANFNSNNPSSSSVWVSVSGGTGAAFWNRIYKVNADTGHIDTAATIDVQQIPTPEGGVAFAGKAVHYIEVDSVGNLVISLQAGTAMSGQSSRYFAVLAPNNGTNATSLTGVDLTLPLSATGTTSQARVANTGDQQVTFTINVTDNAGIVADNVQVAADLTALNDGNNVALTRGTVSADGKSAPYTLTYTVPADVNLDNSGSFDIPFQITANSSVTGITARVTQVVYNAYKPLWAATTAGAVNSSPAGNGPTAYIGDDAGNVYAVDTATGGPAANFGGGSGFVTLDGPVRGRVEYFRGRLYVATPNTVYVLNGGTGATLGSKALAGVSSVAIDDSFPTSFFAAAGNTIVKLNATTAAQEAVTPDLGAKVNRVAVVPSFSFTALVVAGTEGEPSGENAGKNGKIVAYMADGLTAANGTDGVLATDAAGPVRSRADWSNDGSNYHFAIGGASGLYYFNADTLGAEPWSAGSGGGANVGGNPYTPGAPVDANPAFPKDVSNGTPGAPDYGKEATRIAFATTNGNLILLTSSTGERSSYGGYPVPLTLASGSGFAAGAGILGVNPSTAGARTLYIGSDAVDQRFYALDTKPDDVSYSATAAKKHIFDPSDTSAFPGAVAGAFNSTPALAADKVVVGSAAKRVYGFASLTATKPGVTSVNPANGATGVATSAGITVNFNADVSAAILDPFTTTMLLDDTGTAVNASATLGADSKSIVIQPSSPLTVNKTYTVVITLNAGVQPFSSSFYTGIPPAVQGDVNGNGVFDLQDAAEALRIAGGVKAATAKAVTATGDKVTPGSITVEDAVFLARVKAGLASF